MTDVERAVDRFMTAYNARDPEAVAALYLSNGWHGEAASERRNHGPEAISKGLSHFLAALPDATWKENGRILAGCQALVFYEMTGHLDGQLGPFGGIGQPIVLEGAFALTLDRDGRILTSLDYWNPTVFARQARLEGVGA